jgi:peptidoglycan/xylan/chitin deacetylase (PgdA/CDA1 family)
VEGTVKVKRIGTIVLAALMLLLFSGCMTAYGHSATVQTIVSMVEHEPVYENGSAVAKATKPDSAVIIFTFDDGSISDYTLAYPILNGYNIRGTSYLVTKYTDLNYPGKMNWTQIKEMAQYGWVFGCHTYEHIRLTQMTDDQIRTSMKNVDQSFVRQGFPAPQIMAYPYGQFNQRVINDIKPYRNQARVYFNDTKYIDLKNVNSYAIDTIIANMTTIKELNSLEKLVDKAVEQKGIVVFTLHCLYKEKPYDTVPVDPKLSWGYNPQADSKLFAQLVSYCVERGCAFMTMRQLKDLYSSVTDVRH